MLSESDPSCRQFRVLADMLKVRFEQIEPRRAGFAAYWNRVAERQQSKSALSTDKQASSARGTGSGTPVNEVAPNKEITPDTATRWHNWSTELESLLGAADSAPVQRYEALTQSLSVLGRTVDEDTVEILQAGLASMRWDQLPPDKRRQFASHLRELAGQIAPAPVEPAESINRPGASREPRYDEVQFGSQEALLRALQDQPDHVSLDAWLDRITRRKPGPGK